MTANTNLSRLSVASIFGLALIATAASMSPANAGRHNDGNGGAVCKGIGSCLVLELDCKGTYTDATQKDGTVYGHCDQVQQVRPGVKGGKAQKTLRRSR